MLSNFQLKYSEDITKIFEFGYFFNMMLREFESRIEVVFCFKAY
jgi:hypothetical protein